MESLFSELGLAYVSDENEGCAGHQDSTPVD